ncbi:MAG TPA: DUF6691 family protein [Parvularculaceae bacterium]|nr:DUF6691 family protein [Parvularculaceae bacterium]
MRAISAFLIGILFGLGLVISGMVNPQRVIGFLDVTGTWDPTLLFVMAGALAATFIGYRLVLMRTKPLLDEKFILPTKTTIDRRLIIGASLFGVGWGLGGFCPGPGVTALSIGAIEPVVFVAAMLVGMATSRLVEIGGAKAAF